MYTYKWLRFLQILILIKHFRELHHIYETFKDLYKIKTGIFIVVFSFLSSKYV